MKVYSVEHNGYDGRTEFGYYTTQRLAIKRLEELTERYPYGSSVLDTSLLEIIEKTLDEPIND